MIISPDVALAATEGKMCSSFDTYEAVTNYVAQGGEPTSAGRMGCYLALGKRLLADKVDLTQPVNLAPYKAIISADEAFEALRAWQPRTGCGRLKKTEAATTGLLGVPAEEPPNLSAMTRLDLAQSHAHKALVQEPQDTASKLPVEDVGPSSVRIIMTKVRQALNLPESRELIELPKDPAEQKPLRKPWTYEDLLTWINKMTPEQRKFPALWMGDEISGGIYGSCQATEDHVDAGDGWEPVSTYAQALREEGYGEGEVASMVNEEPRVLYAGQWAMITDPVAAPDAPAQVDGLSYT